MQLQFNETALGVKFVRVVSLIFFLMAAPMGVRVLCYYHNDTVQQAIDALRPVPRNAVISIEDAADKILESRIWTWAIAGGSVAWLLAVQCFGIWGARKLGTDTQKLVGRLMHDLRNVLVDVGELARRIGRRRVPLEAGLDIAATCHSTSDNIAKYMQLLYEFNNYPPSSATEEDVDDLIRHMVENTKDKAHDVAVDYEGPPGGLYGKIHVDLIIIVVNELLDNAVKYTEKGSVKVTLERVSKERMCIVISDTGCGMTIMERLKACGLFYRSENAKKKTNGHGVGLTLVSRIVKGHYHGKLRIKSKPGEGTTVTVTLPRYFV